MAESFVRREESIEDQYAESARKAQDMSNAQILDQIRAQESGEKKEGTPATPGGPDIPIDKATLDPKKHALSLIEKGISRDDVERDWGPGAGLQPPEMLLDPVDRFVDIVTGGLYGGAKIGISAGVGAVAKGVAKGAVGDLGRGLLAETFMRGTEETGAGPIVQTLSGLIGPTATSALITGGRQAFISFLRRTKSTNPKLHKEITQGLAGIKDEQAQATLNKILGEGGELPIVKFKSQASDIEKSLPALKEGYVRLWRGNRLGEVGKNPSFTNDLPGIALPFKEAYKGELSYLDIPEMEFKKLKTPAGSTDAEFIVTPEMASQAKKVESVQGAFGSPGTKAIELSPKAQEDWDNLNILKENWDSLIQKQRRGERPHTLAIEEAKQISVTRDRINRILPGTTMNDSEALALDDYIMKIGTIAQEAAKRGDTDTATRAFLHMTEALVPEIGVVAEAGRTLSAMNVMQAYKSQFVKMIEEGKGVSIDKFMGMLATAKSPEALAKMAKEATKPGMGWMLTEIWLADLLTGPATQIANIAGDITTTALAPVLRGMAAYFHTGSNSGVVKGEATDMIYGFMNTFTDALRLAARTARTGQSAYGNTKMETYRKAVTGENVGMTGSWAKGVDLLGEIIRGPFRALITADDFFKHLNRGMEIPALARRKAMNDFPELTGKALDDKIAAFVAHPTREMLKGADEFAAKQTFVEPLGKVGKSISDFSNSHPAAKAILPFVNAPVNLSKYTFELIPGVNALALLSTDFRNEIKAGGVTRDMALAKLGLGSTMAGLVAGYVAMGKITGKGPEDKNLRRTLQMEEQGYSFKTANGDTYKYDRISPLGQFIGTVSDFTEMVGKMDQKDAEKIGLAITLSLTRNITNKTFMTGLADFVDILTSESPAAGKAPTVARRMVGSIVPSMAAQIRRIDDPYAREVSSMLDAIYNRVPGLSSKLPYTRDLKGDKVILPPGWGVPMLNPITAMKSSDDPVVKEILKQGVSIPWPAKSWGGGKPPSGTVGEERPSHGVELMPFEYEHYSILAGNGTKVGGKGMWDRLTELVTPGTQLNASYNRQSNGPDGGKAVMIKSIVQGYREMAQSEMRKDPKYRELDYLVRQKEGERMEALKPIRMQIKRR